MSPPVKLLRSPRSTDALGALMSTSSRLLSLGSNTPTASASKGVNITLPLLAVVAPWNDWEEPMIVSRSARLKDSYSNVLSLGSNIPTASAL